MSNTRASAQRHHNVRHGARRAKPAATPIAQGTVYFLAFLIGGFTVMIGCLITSAEYLLHWTFGYVALLLYNVNLEGWLAYAGKHRSDWRQALAAIPLRFAGFGGKNGKPMSAARSQPGVRTALLGFGVFTLAAFAAMIYLLWRRAG